MSTVQTICLTVFLCFGSLVGVLWYAVRVADRAVKKFSDVNIDVDKRVGVRVT